MGILRSRFAPFCSAKKSTDSKPNGLPSVALAKDGGGYAPWQRTLLFKIFYAQMIKKFVIKKRILYRVANFRKCIRTCTFAKRILSYKLDNGISYIYIIFELFTEVINE